MAAAAALAIVCSCTPDDYPVYMTGPGEGERVEMNLSLDLGLADTKASILSGVESVSSGATAYVFYHDTGKLDSVQSVPGGGSGTISVPAGVPIDLLVTGNLWAVSRSNGATGSMLDALGASFPSDRSGVEALTYLLDGGQINASWRRESFDEVAIYGLPYSGRREGVTVSAGMNLSVICTRLFSKVNITIDHSGLDGGADETWFRNGKCYIRQANGRLAPFSTEPQKALSSSDIIEGDYDPSMSNGHSLTFTFYIPENMQGTLLSSNTDQNAKTYDNLVSSVGSDRAGLLTYVEFTGTVDPSAGGYGGDVVYRFYLGTDNTTNFDLHRGRSYDVTLGFRVNSLFDPWWQVSTGLMSDTRLFCLTSDAAGTQSLPDGQIVAVRKSRPGRMYVYMNPDGVMGSNSLLGKAVADAGYNASDLSDCAWTSNFISASNNASQVPERSALAAMGITPSFDPSTGLLSFTVTDNSKFSAGKECSLTLRLLPGDRTVTLKVRTYEEMSVSWDKSTTDGFYTAMQRTATFNGYCGPVRYKSDRTDILKKAISDEASYYIGSSFCSDQSASGSLTIYAYSGPGDSFSMHFTPEDTFNDGDAVIDTSVKVCTPVLLFANPDLDIILNVTGEYSSAHAFYYHPDANPANPEESRMIPVLDFNQTLYYKILDYDFQLAANPTAAETAAYDATFSVYKDSHAVTTNKYRSYSICRKALFSSNYPGCIDAVFKGRPAKYSLYAVAKCGTVSSNSAPLLLAPVMDNSYSVTFADSYHDYTLLDSDKLDEPYRSAATNYSSAGGEFFYTERDSPYLSLCAVPTDPGSDGYSEGVSQSVNVTLSDETIRRVMISFKDSPTIRHSAGPHEIRATATNKRSGETITGVVGSFKVYVDFVVGADLELVYLGDSQAEFHVWPVMMSAVNRTSCGTWFASFGVSTDDAESQDLSYEYFDKTQHDYVKIAHGTKTSKGPSFAYYEEPFYELYDITLYKETGYTGFEFDNIDEAGYMERFGGQIWIQDSVGDLKKELGVVVYNMKDDAAGGVGYYTFHRLKDLCSASKGWVKLYEKI